MVSISTLWSRIKSCEGQTFRQIRGGEFTYNAYEGYIELNRTNHNISRSHFEKALSRVPLKNTALVQDLRGPSYIYAILMDERIRMGNW